MAPARPQASKPAARKGSFIEPPFGGVGFRQPYRPQREPARAEGGGYSTADSFRIGNASVTTEPPSMRMVVKSHQVFFWAARTDRAAGLVPSLRILAALLQSILSPPPPSPRWGLG